MIDRRGCSTHVARWRVAALAALLCIGADAAAGVAEGDRGAAEFLAGPGMPYAAFDRLPQTDIALADGAVLKVGFAPGRLSPPQRTVLDWVRHSAQVVDAYYGRFPLKLVRVLIVPVDGRGVRGGTTWGYRGAAIRLVIGRDSDAGDLQRDWKIVHEMVHLALPDVGQDHRWLSEGLATYVEPIARARAGDLAVASVWSDMLRDMPKGLPRAGSQGLDRTQTWASTYWGGALFCLLADVEIRRRTDNRLGLRDAMRGVLAAGGDQEADWPIARVLATGDRTTGTQVLAELYARMATRHAAPQDLEALWRDLGVRRGPDGRVEFDDTRPLANIRRALIQPRAE